MNQENNTEITDQLNEPSMKASDLETIATDESSSILTSDGAFTSHWYEQFDSLKEVGKTLQKFKSPETLAKSYAELERLRQYPDTSDHERMHQFRLMVGLPESSDEYQLECPEGLDESSWNNAFAQEVAQTAYQYGVPASAMSALQEVWMKNYQEQSQAWSQDQEKQLQETEQQLRSKWGQEYEANIQKASQALYTIGKKSGAQVESLIDDPVLGSHGPMIELLYEVSHLLEESPLKRNDSIVLSGRDEARRIESDPTHPLFEAYMKYNHPNHQYANQVYDRLMKR